MKINHIVFGGILALGTTLHAGTALTTLTSGGSNPDSSAVSPYSGSIGGQAVTLICDDYNDHASIGKSYTATVTNVGTGTINSSDSRFGGAAGYPAATTLYDEIVWLSAQLVGAPVTTGANAANNEVEIQEAIWQLTDPKNNGGSSSLGSPTTTYSSETQTYLQWEQDAKYAITHVGSYAVGTAASYLTPDYNDWYIVTDVAANGCTSGGSTGTYHDSGCSGTGNQEFLAYYNSTGPQSTTTAVTGTPEPASFLLIGSGFLGAFLIRKRRKV
jgi:hypothetical protein